MKKISIIVPVYNVENYLRRCITSIVSSNVSPEEYELIIVNDGSTDGSRNVLEQLYAEYPFIQIIDKENGGLSSARNEGLKHAVGEYIFFIDSDDWIADDSLPFLLGWIEQYPVDILLFGMCETNDNGEIKKKLISNLAPNNQILAMDNYLNLYTLRSCVCQSLFARKLITESNLQFKLGFISEDDDFAVKIFSLAKQIVCNNKLIYYYYQRCGSISKSTSLSPKLIRDKLTIIKELDIYTNTFHGKIRQGLQRKMNFLAIDIIRILIRKNHSSATINKTLNELKAIKYYPLPKASYSTKYQLFRIITYKPWMIKLARPLKRYI